MKLLTENWDGKVLTRIVKTSDNRFKIKAGLSNGKTDRHVLILGITGWSVFLLLEEVGSVNENLNVSYMSDESERLAWANECSNILKEKLEWIIAE